jgi:tetratricopeptide (TPR) repeat protein
MNRRSGLLLAAFLLAFISSAKIQAQTLARLAHDATADIPRSTTTVKSGLPPTDTAQKATLRESALARLAARALFVDSNLDRARLLSARGLARDPQDAEALFVRMEVAVMQADNSAMLQSAAALAELGAEARQDARVRLAAARLRNTAANTADFRDVIPRLQAVLANSPQPWPDLQEALLKATMDGAPGLDPYSLSRSAGILTDWRIVGPLGLHPLLDQQPISPNDDLAQDSYQNRRVENFAFPDGRIVLPHYLSRRGIFFAATAFSSLISGSWTARVESAGALEVFVDGQRVLRGNDRGNNSVTFNVIPGPHRVLLKFLASATPLRISIAQTVEPSPATLPRKASAQEMRYLLAAADYAAGQYATTASQIESVAANANSAPLRFLLADSKVRVNPTTSDSATVWDTAYSVCKMLLSEMDLYRSQGQLDAAHAAQQKLDGCAPESLDYAQSLSADGDHAAAVRALHRLLAAAPLNRAARQMLVRESQLAGDDAGARQAAVEWLRIAPNAEDYHRLAAGWTEEAAPEESTPSFSAWKDFYAPYRRDAAVIARKSADTQTSGDTVMLLDDHVAIARPDGSVSLYVHRTTRALTEDAAAQLATVKFPRDARVLAMRILHSDGSTAALNHGAGALQPALSPGDAIDEEHILNYSGDGGIPEHAEAFQFVFGSFDEQVLYSRFVVLTPADQADRGAVISTGRSPAMTTAVRNGMVERVWEKQSSADAAAALPVGAGMAIVRVVQDEHGWSEPSSAEHRHKIDTIHPGPRPAES